MCSGWRSPTKWRRFFPFFQTFWRQTLSKWIIEFLIRLNEGHQQFLDFKKMLKLLKNLVRAYTQLQFEMAIQSGRPLKGAKFNNKSRNSWKPLFQVDFSKNSTKTIRLFALDFYEVIVDSACRLDHLLSSQRNLALII